MSKDGREAQSSVPHNNAPDICLHSKGTLIDLGEAMHQVPTNVSISILAGYTYLGQFIDHDITHTFGSDVLASGDVSPHSYVNLAAANLELTSVYDSKGWHTQPGLNTAQATFNLSAVIDDDDLVLPHLRADLPRHPHTRQALIPDQRNDENLLVAQIHVLFLKLHNHFVLQMPDSISPEQKFERAQKQVISTYQSIVIHDFLRTLLHYDIWKLFFSDIADTEIQAFRQQPPLFYKQGVPIEFSAAAFRFGHSMVREKYRLNATTQATLSELFHYTGRGKLNGKTHLPLSHIPDLHAFFTPGAMHEQKANDIRPHVGIDIPDFSWPANRLAIRNLFRAQTLGLPSAQWVTQKILQHLPASLAKSLDVLSGDEISHPVLDSLSSKAALQNSTPLWFYVLLEASKKGKSRTLGPIASFIIAETFYQLLPRENKGKVMIPIEKLSMRDIIAITNKTGGQQL